MTCPCGQTPRVVTSDPRVGEGTTHFFPFVECECGRRGEGATVAEAMEKFFNQQPTKGGD